MWEMMISYGMWGLLELPYYETKRCMLCHNIYTNQGVNVSSAQNSGIPDTLW